MRRCPERAPASGTASLLLACAYALVLAGCLATVEPAPGEEDDVAAAEQALIFAGDQRQEYGQASSQHQFWSRSVAQLVVNTEVSCTGTSCALTPQPWTTEIANGGRLCSNVRYRGQPTLSYPAPRGGGFCTGFLVAPDLIVSAAHCMYFTGFDCPKTRFVFGYQADASGGNVPTSVPQEDVYSCTQSTDVFLPDFAEDWVLYKLDRPVAKRVPLVVRYTSGPAVNTPLLTIGHPNGLPLKFSPSGTVTSTTATLEFEHNLDVFSGNSGGPVFDRDSGVVQGIHRGLQNATYNHFFDSSDAAGACRAERNCLASGCTPPSPPSPAVASATRITRLAHLIPLVPALAVVAIGAAL